MDVLLELAKAIAMFSCGFYIGRIWEFFYLRRLAREMSR